MTAIRIRLLSPVMLNRKPRAAGEEFHAHPDLALGLIARGRAERIETPAAEGEADDPARAATGKANRKVAKAPATRPETAGE